MRASTSGWLLISGQPRRDALDFIGGRSPSLGTPSFESSGWPAILASASTAAGSSRSSGWLFCHISWTCPRDRTAAWSKRSAVQHGFRDCDRMPTRIGDLHWDCPSMDVGTEVLAHCGCGGRGRRALLFLEGAYMKYQNKSRLPIYAFVIFTFAISALPAEAHLNTTGMGPFYDGSMHFLMSPEDIPPRSRLGVVGWTAWSKFRT